MGTHPIFESDFDCLTDMRLREILFSIVLGLIHSKEDNLKPLSAEEVASRPKKYLLYDTNPGEGFNLRRDVYMRVAGLVRYMRQFDNWTLVLPPWGRIGYHWRERNLEQSKIPWSKFFDTEQLSRYVPTLELTDYFEEIGEEKVEEIWYLKIIKKDGEANGKKKYTKEIASNHLHIRRTKIKNIEDGFMVTIQCMLKNSNAFLFKEWHQSLPVRSMAVIRPQLL